MPNANRDEEKRVLDFLNAEGVTEDRLNELLEEELSKPKDQIDMQLVKDMLSELEPEQVSEDEINASWQRLEKKIDSLHSGEAKTHPGSVATKKKPWFIVLRNIGLGAAAVVILFYVSIGTAKATRWSFLLKLLQPITETFGIKLGDDLEPMFEEEYAFALDEGEMTIFYSTDEIPEKYKGYSIKLSGIPERFSFLEGSFYPTDAMDSFDFTYIDGEDWLSYNVNIFKIESAGIKYEFETTLEADEKRYIGMIEVSFYHNGHEDTQSVSWVDRDAHYALSGTITMDELNQIIGGIV
ncbi:MAG: hypothetical protein IKH57_05450 [Clostridia bacterium]|nr:hypothetical protein [Clostridia bacterium]